MQAIKSLLSENQKHNGVFLALTKAFNYDWVVTIKWTSSNLCCTYSDPRHLPNEQSFQLSIEAAAVLSVPVMPGKGLSSTGTHGSPSKQNQWLQLCLN